MPRSLPAFVLASLLAAIIALRPSAAPAASAVVLSQAGDPYHLLASEISRAESLPLALSLEDALKHRPAFLIWVVAPGSLSEQAFSRFGAALNRHGEPVSVGLISGSTLEKARALWRRKPASPGRRLSVVPREGDITLLGDSGAARFPPSRDSVVARLSQADYVMYQGHGTRSLWAVNENENLTAADIPPVPGQIVAAGACQTFKLWSPGSIALAFTDAGAAAYVGALHSPFGNLFGDPAGFPFRYTHPDFPIGHVVQAQNRGLMRGGIAWPYYLLLGDPRLSLQPRAPYRLVSDRTSGSVRTLSFTGAPRGIIPVRIPGAARFRFAEIPGVGRASQREVFFNPRLQMISIGPDSFLLFRHPGGDFTVRLRPSPPWHWRALSCIGGAMDHTATLQHAQGSIRPMLYATGLLALVLAFTLRRKTVRFRNALPRALFVGLALLALRGGYALARHAQLALQYESSLRTMDAGFDISPAVLVSTLVLGAGGAWVFLNSRSSFAKLAAILFMLFPTWAVALMWAGVSAVINAMARKHLGMPIYGYGSALAALITLAAEGAIVAAALWLGGRLARSGAPNAG